MKEEDKIILKKIRQRISTLVRVVDFRLFGSRSRGDAGEFSDMDIFIEVEGLTKEIQEKIENIVWDVSYEHLIFISPLIFTKNEIENSPLKESDIVKNIMEEGISI